MDSREVPLKSGDRDFGGSSTGNAKSIWSILLVGLWEYRHSLRLLCDLLLIILAFVCAYYLRFNSDLLLSLFPVAQADMPSLEPYFKTAILTGLIWVFLLWKEGNYQKDLFFLRSLLNQIHSIIVTGSFTVLFIMVMSFMYRYFLLSRITYVMGFILAGGMLVLERRLLAVLERRMSEEGLIGNRVIFLGDSPSTNILLTRMMKLKPSTEIVGHIVRSKDEGAGTCVGLDSPDLGTIDDLDKIYQEKPFNQLIIGNNSSNTEPSHWDFSNHEIIKVLNFCEEKNILVYTVPDFFEITVGRKEVGSLAGIPLIRLQDSSVHPGYAPIRRLMDITIALAVLTLGMPVWLLIALLIKTTSKGPVFFTERRAGLHGKPFTIYKYRSMVDGADEMLQELVDFDAMEEPVFNIRQDPRVTGIGRFLRRTSLDEIPQLINVLVGSMSIVGPRPERVELVERYNSCQRRRLKAKPGLTGYQQVMSRGEPSLAKRIEYDLYYMKYQGFLLDLYIILKTIVVIVKGDGMR